MPHYDYACSGCGHQFETFQSMSEATLTECPECGKPSLRRLIGAGAGLIFKGSGFYITDYKGNNKKSGADSSGSDASGEGKKSDSGKSESKPAASKKETKD